MSSSATLGGGAGGIVTADLPGFPADEGVWENVNELDESHVGSDAEERLPEGFLTEAEFRKLVGDRLSEDHIARLVAVDEEGGSLLVAMQRELRQILQGQYPDVSAAEYLAALNIAMHQLQGEDGSRTEYQLGLLAAVKACTASTTGNPSHLVASLAMSRIVDESKLLTSSEISKVVKSLSVHGNQIKQNCANRTEVENTFKVLAKDASITSYFLNVHESSGETPMQGKHLIDYLQGAASGIASDVSTKDQVFKLTQDKQDDHLPREFTSEQMCQLVRIADILHKQGEISETDRLTAIVDKVLNKLDNDTSIENMKAYAPGSEASPGTPGGGMAGGSF